MSKDSVDEEEEEGEELCYSDDEDEEKEEREKPVTKLYFTILRPGKTGLAEAMIMGKCLRMSQICVLHTLFVSCA